MIKAEDVQGKRAELKKQYGIEFDKLSALLFTEDPGRVNFEVNTDEYEGEVLTILPRLPGCRSVSDVRLVVHEELVNWFGNAIGPPERYQALAERIWQEIIPHLQP
jgi:hypothetical protein